MAGFILPEGGQEPPSPSDLQHAGSNGKANGNHALVSAVDAQANHLKVGVKESPKRKKASKMAKLKQSKLDARREQWLSQVSGRKSPPSQVSSNGDVSHPCAGETTIDESFPAESTTPSNTSGNGTASKAVSFCTESKGHSNGSGSDSNGHSKDSSNGYHHGGEKPVLRRWQTQPALRSLHDEEAAPKDAATSQAPQQKAQKAKMKKGVRPQEGPESNEGGGDADDWEAAAEALGVVVPESGSETGVASENGSHSHLAGDESGVSTASEGASPRTQNGYLTRRLAPEVPDACARHHHRAGAGGAWRQDDSHRPGTLPRLEKFNSFPVVPHNHTGSMWEATISRTMWGSSAAPATCPICTEELDLTDTSFVPCPCGFRLCLFCHHRIALDDGRCPGCRQAYVKVEKVEKYIQVPRSHLVRLKV
ncbi:Zinc finger RING-type domain containing protein [Klebsormidium nitens]|uniref:Zinc finger RING-type domain containing protein n=1 Tax=Klebsormidium nitens TaxID=105231 RepID=A0A1Y1IFY6_KLENI|nr:Zinc finger RING-type domain containing protein [Klebsormidium nitens]|eukprot:GAQ88409.1 Zinc finger RING-type domain containing protein [Klebsormidium nitens]